MRRALAICWRISADGFRSPRSIWLRYGFEIPATSDSFRSDMRPTWRCSRMNWPRSVQRSSNGCIDLLQQRLDRGLAGPVPAGDLGLQRVDALVQRPAPAGDLGLVAREALDQRR